MTVDWELNRFEGKNPQHTGSFLTSYDAREFTPDEVVARESGQNALDAGKDINKPTKLVFHEISLAGSKKKELRELLKFDEMLLPRVQELEANDRNRIFVENIKKFFDDSETQLLLIRDYETCGLGGDWQSYEPEDHFGRLVCALNLDDKSDGDATQGGSYGLGKTAYAKSSLLNTVVYHSVFSPTERSKNINRRLMATGIYPKHNYKNEAYGGFAYFGEQVDQNNVKPLENEAAEEIWGRIASIIGQEINRSDNENGTDILIFMHSVSLENIKTAIEDYYFPALLQNKLQVEFIDKSGKKDYPSPINRKDLDQFVRLFQQANKKINKEEERAVSKSLYKHKGQDHGWVAFEAAEEDESLSSKNNCVAISRGTGMILNYLKLGADRYEPAVGVLIADAGMSPLLNLSENAAHSVWDENSRRLFQKYGEDGKESVARLNNAVSRRFSSFQKSLQPDVTSTRSESGYLARLLAGALKGSKGSKRPVSEYPNPVSISLQREIRDNHNSRWHLLVTQNENTPQESFELILSPSISIAGDLKNIPIKQMEFQIKNKEGKIIEKGSKPTIKTKFSTGQVLDYYVEFSNPGRFNYVVKCKFEAVLENQYE